MNLYLVAVLLNPTAKQKHDEGLGPKIIVEPKAVMARDEASAAMQAQRFVPAEYSETPVDRLEVLILPFKPAAR